MKTLQASKAKTHFSAVLQEIKKGKEIVITYGKSEQEIAVIIPYEKWKHSQKRKLGSLEGKTSVHFAPDF